MRAQEGDDAVGVFYQDVSRAFFTKHADISKRAAIVPAAERFGISGSQVEAAWNEHQFSPAVELFMSDGLVAGVTGVPAMGWPRRHAIVIHHRVATSGDKQTLNPNWACAASNLQWIEARRLF